MRLPKRASEKDGLFHGNPENKWRTGGSTIFGNLHILPGLVNVYSLRTGTWPSRNTVVDLPINMLIFHSYVSLPEGNLLPYLPPINYQRVIFHLFVSIVFFSIVFC